MTTYRWARPGDVNAFFGLMLDNLAVLGLLVALVTAPGFAEKPFTAEFVVARMIPGTALGVLIGDLVYTWMAFRLAKRTGKDDVTAMPLGLDTPSTFGVTFLVLQPALVHGLKLYPDDHGAAMSFAWHVGAITLVFVGIFKSLFAPLGTAVRRLVPRAGLLGSLAAVALVLISFMPLLEIGGMPLVGFGALTVILIALVAHRPLPWNIPGALAAVLAGVGIYVLCLGVQALTGWPLVHELRSVQVSGVVPPLPALAWEWAWWEQAGGMALEKLPLVLPFALATIVGGLDCTESAAAVGDEYDTRAILLTEGLASVAAGLCGGVIQNTPYIGQPAYKAMGGRAAYTLAVALFVGVAGFFGWFGYLFGVIPPAALYPILVFVGLEITAQSFRATPPHHYPALALAVLPLLAYLVCIWVNPLSFGKPPDERLQTVRCLGNGFIVTSLIWGAALAELLDGRNVRSAGYLYFAALCSLFGIIHSPLASEEIGWPWQVMARAPEAAKYLSPYHWAASYVLAGALVLALGRKVSGEVEEAEGKDTALS